MPFRNDVFQYHGVHHRLLHVDPRCDTAWIINLTRQKSFPEAVSNSRLQAEVAEKDVVRLDTGADITATRASAAAAARRERTWTRIAPLAENPDIFDRKIRGPLVRARARSVGCSPTTLYTLLQRFWRGGQTRDALLPNFKRCGHPRDGITGKRGRKADKNRYTVYQMADEDLKNIEKTVKKTYLKGELHTLRDAHQRLREKYYSYFDGNGACRLRPIGEYPTYRQFVYAFKRLFPEETVIRRRKGDKSFERDHAPKLGSILDSCLGVGHVYEVDATFGDLWLVPLRDRSRIIGKPTLYLLIDRWSRLIAGFYVGLEAPSWPAALQCILSISEDKKALCQKYGIPYDPADWPAHQVFPQIIVADRGELLGKDSSRIADGLEGTVVNTPSESPQSKPLVECGFKLIHAPIAPTVPGYEPPSNPFKRRGKAYDKDACLNIDEFTGIILKAIIKHNTSIMKGYPLSIDAISRRVRPVPVELWRDNISHRMGALSRYTEQHLRFKLLPVDEATVTDAGIRFRGCFYTCETAERDGWFVKARRGRSKVPVSYDARLVDAIYIHDPTDSTAFLTATLLPKSQEYTGLSFAEVQFWQSKHRDLIRDAEDTNPQLLSEFNAYADAICKPAHAEMRQVTKGKSRKKRKRDIAADRLAERTEIRQREASPINLPDAAPDHQSQKHRGGADVISLSRRKSRQTGPASAPPHDSSSRATAGTAPENTLAAALRRKRKEMFDENS